MREQAEVKGIQVLAKKWEKYGKERIYFTFELPPSAGSKKLNQACYDCQSQEFTSCNANFFKSPGLDNFQAQEWEEAIKEAFELN